ncbi:MAG: CapA family protein [Myxococcota bacterium]
MTRIRRRGVVGGAAGLIALGGLRGTSSSGTSRWWFGGDAHLGDRRPRLGDAVRARLGGVGVVNLEGPLGAGPYARVEAASARVWLANAPTAVAALRDVGVGVVTRANNHRFDLGAVEMAPPNGLIALPTIDSPSPSQWLDRATRLFVHDLSEGAPPPAFPSPVRGEASGQTLVVSLHVTGPPSYLPRPATRAVVAQALAAGARLVLVHGTHVLGPVTRHDGPQGKALVAWGLGNLWFSCACTRSREGLIVVLDVAAEHLDVTLVPVDAGLDGAPAVYARDAALAFDLLDAIGSDPGLAGPAPIRLRTA